MKLSRNLNTEVVHRPECSSRGNRTPRWTYAIGKTLAQITDATAACPWLHLCRICLPGACACNRCAEPDYARRVPDG
jgi:hypothetical protein